MKNKLKERGMKLDDKTLVYIRSLAGLKSESSKGGNITFKFDGGLIIFARVE